MERLIRDRRFDTHPAYSTPIPRWPGVAGFLAVFSIPLGLIAALQPRPCEVQGQPRATSTITTGQVTQTVAAANRAAIDGVAAVQLPPGLVQVDKTITPVSGQTVQGPAVLQNAYDANSRTLTARGGGLGYCDMLKVTGPHAVQFTDPSVAANYVPGGMAYLFHVDGFQDGTGQLRTLQQVASVGVGTARFNGVALDPRLTGGKWFAKCAVVGNTSAGMSSLLLMTPQTFAVGDWVQLTSGPEVANEGREEWLRVAGVNPLRFAWPTQRAYTAAVLAVAQPITGVRLSNLTLAPSPAVGIGTAQINYALGWRLDNVTVQGAWYISGCAYHVYTGCTFDDVLITASHDCTFINCQFKTTRLEEASFNCSFQGCTWTGSFGCNTATERLTLRGCRLNGPQAFMGITAPNSTLDALDATGAAYVALQGNGWTVRNCAGCPLLLQQGSGVVLDCQNVQKQAGSWKVLP